MGKIVTTFLHNYLVRHVIDIKLHIPVSVVHIGHPKKGRLIEDHNIYQLNQNKEKVHLHVDNTKTKLLNQASISMITKPFMCI